jgi:hypothetical protein
MRGSLDWRDVTKFWCEDTENWEYAKETLNKNLLKRLEIFVKIAFSQKPVQSFEQVFCG